MFRWCCPFTASSFPSAPGSSPCCGGILTERLFFHNKHNTCPASLDPTYLQLYDASLYDQWVENPSQVIANVFGARYVHSDLNHKEFLRAAASDPGPQAVYRDPQAVIFKVVPQGGEAGAPALRVQIPYPLR